MERAHPGGRGETGGALRPFGGYPAAGPNWPPTGTTVHLVPPASSSAVMTGWVLTNQPVVTAEIVVPEGMDGEPPVAGAAPTAGASQRGDIAHLRPGNDGSGERHDRHNANWVRRTRNGWLPAHDRRFRPNHAICSNLPDGRKPTSRSRRDRRLSFGFAVGGATGIGRPVPPGVAIRAIVDDHHVDVGIVATVAGKPRADLEDQCFRRAAVL